MRSFSPACRAKPSFRLPFFFFFFFSHFQTISCLALFVSLPFEPPRLGFTHDISPAFSRILLLPIPLPLSSSAALPHPTYLLSLASRLKIAYLDLRTNLKQKSLLDFPICEARILISGPLSPGTSRNTFLPWSCPSICTHSGGRIFHGFAAAE